MGWFKTWDLEWLEDETLKKVGMDGQGAFVRLKCVANDSLDSGRFSIACKIPLEKAQIIAFSGITDELFDRLSKEKLVFYKDGFWVISGYKKWQSEYSRQKGYRHKLQSKVTTKGTSEEVRSKK